MRIKFEIVKKLGFEMSVIFLILSIFTVTVAEIDIQFATQRHIPAPRFTGLSGAGSAVPEDISSMLLNPALVHTWHMNLEKKYSVVACYERDSLFSKGIINSGVSWYINEKNTIGINYRCLMRGENSYQNEVVLCLAGRMFGDKVDKQGPVDLGMNIRFENLKWETIPDSLLVVTDTLTGTEKITDTVLHHSGFDFQNIEEKRLLFDIGFFQSNIIPGLDFAIVFQNLFGFRWNRWRPKLSSIKNTVYDTSETFKIDTIITDSSYYIDEWQKEKSKRNPKIYKRMTVGVCYRVDIMNEKVKLLIPFDFEFFGLFDKKRHNMELGFHTGIEGWIINMIGIRFGYAKAPDYIEEKSGKLEFTKDNILSGGMGVKFNKVKFDMYIRKTSWGVGTTVMF